MDINWEYYKIFYYVAKYRNITKAAGALGSNQPNVTRVLRLLESQLGCRLFIREARGVRPTQEGERLYVHVESALKHLFCAQEELGVHGEEGEGTVEIGATETAIHLYLLNAMQEFRGNYPKIRLKIHNHTTPAILRQLVAGQLDFAVVTTPFEVPPAFSCVQLAVFREILAGGVQYQHLCKGTRTLEELKKYPWVGLGSGTATYEFYKKFFTRMHVDIEPDMEVATSDLLIPFICNNFGIGYVPETLARPFIQEGTLIQILLDCEPPARTIEIVTDKGRGRSRAADIFYQHLKRQ